MKTGIAILVISLAVASAWRSGYDCPEQCPGYDPVCSTEENTYDNKCLMTCDLAYKQCDGPCPCSSQVRQDSGQVSQDSGQVPQDSGQVSQDCNCPQKKDYVCTDGNETYDNECEAKCDNKSVRCDGPCPCL